jgi:hypothetical protein
MRCRVFALKKADRGDSKGSWMVVSPICAGNHVTGLKVGTKNVRRYIPACVAEIELQLDHLRIQCGLSPDFWQDQAEIHDPRLSLWLESKQRNGKSCEPAHFAMVPSGENSFSISLVEDKGSKKKAGGEERPRENPYDDI